MGALTTQRIGKEETLFDIPLPLATSQKVYRNGMACVDSSTKTVKKGASGNTNLKRIGTFANSYDNSAGTATVQVMVRLEKEIRAQWFDNDTGAGAITMASNFFSLVYVLDDHTVTATAGSNGNAGRVWDVDAVKGVLVQTTDF